MMTDYAPRRSRNLNNMYSGTQVAVSPFSNGTAVNYLSNTAHMHYSQLNSSYPTFSTPFVPSQHASNTIMYVPSTNSMAMTYQDQSSHNTTLPPHTRAQPHSPYHSTTLQSQRYGPQASRFSHVQEVPVADTEEQESPNQDSMRSEPINPPPEGYPRVEDFDMLMNNYVSNLSPKKQDKALIHAKRAANIKAVLNDKKTTNVESAQFRFWVKKMFTLHPNDPTIPLRRRKICHENKPVAIREKLFKILIRAHKQCQHGGRDKTSAQVRRIYSWVPKELISRFVKLCPTCQIRRGTNRGSSGDSEKSAEYTDTPLSCSPSQPRRDSMFANQAGILSPIQMNGQMNGFSTTFQQQNRWMTPLQHQDRIDENSPVLEHTTSSMNPPDNSLTFGHPPSPQYVKSSRTSATSYSSSSDSMPNINVTTPSYYQQGVNDMHTFETSDMRFRYKQESHYSKEHQY